MGRSNSQTMAAECPVKTGTRTQVVVTARSGRPRILRASLQYFCSSSVSSEPSSTMRELQRDHVVGDRHRVDAAGREVDRRAVEGEVRCPVHRLGELLGELADGFDPAARDGLIRGDHQPPEAGLVVERLEHGNGDHGGAVGVGHDALGDGAQLGGVGFGHDEGDVGVHAPRRGVVDHDGAGGREPGRQCPRDRGRRGAQGEVDAGEVGRLGVLDDDFAVAPRQRRAGGTGRGEVPHGVHGEAALGQDAAQDHAHLPRCSDDGDPHRPIVRDRRVAAVPGLIRPRAAGALRVHARA